MAHRALNGTVLGPIAAVVCTIALGTTTCSVPGDRRVLEVRGLPAFSSPIDGEPVTLAEARARVDYEIPVLPPIALNDPCGGGSEELALQQVWASHESVDRGDRQVAIAYNVGIWMTVTPKTSMSDTIGSELPTVGSFFDAGDSPARLIDGSVRGHSAWINERDADSSCSVSSTWLGRIETTSHLNWVERNLFIHIAGPFSAAELSHIANGVTFV